MKPLLRVSVSLRTLLVFCALLKISQADCANVTCNSIKTETNTTTVTFESRPNCTASIGNTLSGEGFIAGLTPGTVYQIFFNCLNCCKVITMKPGAVSDLSVGEITTSSMSLTWTKPAGNTSVYRVQWTDGKEKGNELENTTETSKTITGLTAGVEYHITITALAADGLTEGVKVPISAYTKPEAVRNLSVSEITTSSVFLNWTEPEGNSSFYKVQWTDGTTNGDDSVTERNINVTELTAGVQHNFTVIAMAGDNKTKSEEAKISHYTKPEAVRDLSVSEITTSSVFLNWTEPEGNSSFYKVQWTDGTTNGDDSVTETNINVTELTAGVQHNFTVIAMAGDNKTKSEEAKISHYTKPEAVRDLSVSEITTSSVFLNWTEPEGNSSFYKVQWTDGKVNQTENVTETHINVTDLTPGVQYEITVTAVAGDGLTEGQSVPVTRYTKPEAVRNLSVSEITTSSVFLNWTEPEGNSSFYKVQWTDGTTNGDDSVTERNINVTELTAGVQHNFTVIAMAGDNKTKSEEAKISHYTKPEAVRDLSVSEITTSSVFLNWTEPEGNSSFYKVQWTDGKVSQTVNVTETHINVTDLTPGVQYEITVTAVAGDGLTEGQSVPVTRYTKPEAVRDLSVSKITTSSVFLNWTEPEGNSSFYKVQWTDGTTNGDDSVTETNINVTELTAGVQHNFTVIAMAGDNKTKSEEAKISHYTKPEAVRNLSVSKITTSSVFLNWTEPEGNRSFYKVQWTDGKVRQTVNVTETHKNVTDLTPGVQYEITVTAVAGDGLTEGQSVAVTRYTKPEAVRNLSVGKITTSSVFLNWTEPEGNSSFYKVQWTDGKVSQTVNVTETHKNVTDLTPGVQYEITVTAVAGDGLTEGQSVPVTRYTKPEAVRNLSVSEITTSSVFLNWTEPEGNSSFYKVQLTDGKVRQTVNVTETHKNVTDLTPGVQYEITVTAVAGDDLTEGQSTGVTQYTRPGKIVGHTVTPNTSSISLSWTPPPGEVLMYRVKWDKGGGSKDTNNTFAVISDLLPGTTYTISVLAVAGDNAEGEPYTFTSVTVPAMVRGLTITNVTTSSISLDWTEPEGNATCYEVLWTAEGGTFTKTTVETSFTINDLTPGVQYQITVAAVAGNSSNKGEITSRTTFTRPDKPVDIQITARGTDNLAISWTLPKGRVDLYVLKISNEQLGYVNSNQTKDATFHFTDLYPGRLYVITVTAVAGNFNNTSDQALFATDPNPPGPINIDQRTNSSLQLKWVTPASMEGAPDISYYITYQPEGGEVQNETTTLNNRELSLLSSGTSYNITVETVGPQNFRSTVVHNSAFTLPNPVLNLEASPKSSTSIKVTWSWPQGARPYYKYLVQINDTMGPVSITTVSNNSTDVPNLEPGTNYSIRVTTIADPGSESTEKHTSSYTMPKAVTNLIVKDVNTTFIQLTWLRQSDHKPSYSYLVIALQDAMMVQNETTKNETFTFFDLIPGQLYTFYVFTVVEGVQSTGKNTSSYTYPEKVSVITVMGNTTSLLVSWTLAQGVVFSYTVRLYRGSQSVGNATDLSNSTGNTLFVGLKPGLCYCVEVVTVTSGPLQSYSSRVCNATFPNPPGPITVNHQTVNSINFIWAAPEDMDHNQYNFSVSTFKGTYLIKNNSFLLDTLESGSPYNISVVTIGECNYESTAMTTENYTRPYPVTNLRQAKITTDSVTLVWEQPESKPNYSYVVQASNNQSVTVSKTTATITGLVSGSNYSFSVTTQTADGTLADPVTVSYFTRPFGITQLEAETLNTTAVRLNWTKPLEYKNEYTYRVETTGCGSQNKTLTTGEVTLISELTQGTNCTFCVFVRAADGIEGEASCTSQFTKPERVQPSISSQGSNSSILVSWTKPPGRVGSYKVYLNSSSTGLEQEQELNSTFTSRLFENLSAGRLFTAMVTTCSGPFNASSGFITNATFPNPPGPIEILTKTTSSINIRWMEAPLMTGASFRYRLTNTLTQRGEYVPASKTNHTFASLLSGTSYNISVATEGEMGFESEKVQIYMITTRPFSVRYLNASPEEESIAVMWDKPDQYKTGYRYRVTWQSSEGAMSNITGETKYNILGLVPGRLYDLNVTTETSDGTQAAPRRISKCTNASPVKNLQCASPNKTNAEVILSWTRPKGQHSGFQISVNNATIYSTSTCCNHTVSDLRHYTDYKLTVKTLSCGQPSTFVSLDCRTGITAPPIPVDYQSLLKVTDRETNKFFLQINTKLLNNTNGPITNVGVLVTDNPPDDTSNLQQYLGNTYDQWKAKETPVYLATVKENNFHSRSEESHLSLVIGDDSKWRGYFNGALDAGGKYQYAIVLFTSLDEQNGIVNDQSSLVSTTNFSPVELKIAITGIAVGATLGIFCVLAIILIGFIIYYKRASNKESPDIQIHSMRAKVSVAVRVEDYEAYYRKQKADSNCGFAEEFEDLKVVGTGQSKTNALILDNKPKNRYNNVLPYDTSRVKLSIIHGNPYDDYINANYMPGHNSRKEFIAAQGPLPATVKDFWRMIWEKNVQTLVMLTRCNEQGRVKCEQYWDSGTKYFENINVTTTSEIPLDDWTIRDFDIKNVKTAETRSVRHFHFTAWPDHGVPETTELLISFRHLVREHMDQYSRHSPTVVHCSAGVGRTGTFIAIDRLLFQIERENIVDVFGIVHDLRMHRPLMVQTEDQYVFLNQCAMDIIRSRTGTNVDLIYQNTAALSIYENIEPKKGFAKNGYRHA